MNVGLVIGLSIAIFILIVLSAIFSVIDIAYATVNQLRLKKDISEKHSKIAKLALSFAENYDDTVTTALFSNNLVNIAASSLTVVLTQEIFKDSLYLELGLTLSSIILLIILLIFGEILPKVLGRSFSYKASLYLAYPLLVLKYVFFPLVFVSSHIGKLFAKPFIKNNKVDNSISNDELQEMVEMIEDEGVIDKDQSELLSNAIEFKDTEAHEIMTPRVKMVAFDIEDDIVSLIQNSNIHAHSRIPIYEGTIDNIIGILPTKTLLRKLLAKEAINLKDIIVPPSFVPGSMGISEILSLMQKSKNHLVIVKDEYGGTDGLLTMEDILEELVGDMFDEYDEVKEDYHKVKNNLYEVNGSMNIDDLFNLLDIPEPEESYYETVGGFVLDKLERFAKVGDKVRYENVLFIVKEASLYNINKLTVKVIKRRKK